MKKIESVFIKPNNAYFSRYSYPKVVGVVNFNPSENSDYKLCYVVVNDDYNIDYIPLSERGLTYDLVTKQKWE